MLTADDLIDVHAILYSYKTIRHEEILIYTLRFSRLVLVIVHFHAQTQTNLILLNYSI